MQVILKETIYFDIDDTLCFSHQGDIEVDYYGQPRIIRPHNEHIAFLKSLKVRGYHITCHSGNGAQWVANVVKALGIEEFVDDCRTKPFKIIDDKPIDNWMPNVIYIPDVQPTKFFFPYGSTNPTIIGDDPFLSSGTLRLK